MSYIVISIFLSFMAEGEHGVNPGVKHLQASCPTARPLVRTSWETCHLPSPWDLAPAQRLLVVSWRWICSYCLCLLLELFLKVYFMDLVSKFVLVLWTNVGFANSVQSLPNGYIIMFGEILVRTSIH